MAKLTLSVDERVVSRAKQYAKRRGVSVSEMVEAYLSAVAQPPGRVPARPQFWIRSGEFSRKPALTITGSI